MLDHTALLNRARESRESLGYTVYVENQNSFRLRGRYASLAGKSDLIAVKNADAVIIDAKTGRPSPHHAVQIMPYQYGIPKSTTHHPSLTTTLKRHCPETRKRRRITPDGHFIYNQPTGIKRKAL